MKRLLALVLVFAALSVSCCAETIDLSAMSFIELRTLQQRIAEELVKRPEWDGVKVSKGYWRVGTDIPAGVYSIQLQDKRDTCFVGVWGFAVDDYTTNGGSLFRGLLRSDAPSIGRIELKDGNILEVGNPVILKPSEGLEY